MNISEVHAQEKGLLAHVLAESCDLYVDQKNEKGLEYKVFCSGYFEALIEQKQHHGDKDIYKCLPTYGDFDPFKIRVIEGFLKKYEVKRYQGDTYVRAFNLANDAIDEQYLLECKR